MLQTNRMNSQRRLLVQQCYVGLYEVLAAHFQGAGRSFIITGTQENADGDESVYALIVITGTQGIGKSLLLYYVMWHLARAGATVVYDQRDTATVMYGPQGVYTGALEEFGQALDDAATWYLVDGKPPRPVAAKTVLVTSLDWDDWKEAQKWPGSLIRHMPVWEQDEILAARELIFSKRPEEEVLERYRVWGGTPRYVLQLTDIEHQRLIKHALNACSIDELQSCMLNISKAAQTTEWLLHLLVESDFTKGPVVFASDWVRDELLQQYVQSQHHQVREFAAAAGGPPIVADFRAKVQEGLAQSRHFKVGVTSGAETQVGAQRNPFTFPPFAPSVPAGPWGQHGSAHKNGQFQSGWW
ncbi:hypothetical protein JKP88DRAFT_262796 [Tribonema minus]|uniref:Uncharacterized protein n=1 Tax=Tribonema minus TaxID=303371 RepID=A0A835Z782_9STRA|nr:hypothetical protein JKP88DRAFT_262796 [Tribonema minus]